MTKEKNTRSQNLFFQSKLRSVENDCDEIRPPQLSTSLTGKETAYRLDSDSSLKHRLVYISRVALFTGRGNFFLSMETFATIVNSEYIWEIPGHCLRVTSLVSQRREDDITVLVEGNNGFDHDGPIVLAFLDKAKPDQQVDFVFTERVVFRTDRTPFAVFGTIEPICENDMESYDSESEDDSEEGSNQWIDSKVNGVIIEEVTDTTVNRKRLRDTEAPELVADEVEISKPKVDLKPSLKLMCKTRMLS